MIICREEETKNPHIILRQKMDTTYIMAMVSLCEMSYTFDEKGMSIHTGKDMISPSLRIWLCFSLLDINGYTRTWKKN